jgi:hypothetical protein
LDGARELRQAAAGEVITPASDKERFVINISFGKGHTINKTVDLKPIKSEREIEPERDEEEEPYEPEWYGGI